MKLLVLCIAAPLALSLTHAEDKPSISPVSEREPISREFGAIHHSILGMDRMHDGVDFKVPEGTPVHATADGVVLQATTIKNYGTVVTIRHSKGIQTFYAHLSKLAVRVGVTVKRGQVIAYSGNSGLSAGPHLHYEVHVNGEKVNPQDYMH